MDGNQPIAGIAVGPVSHAARVAQVFGVTATAFLAGQTAATSYLYLPILLSNTSPSLLLRQWTQMLHIGHKLSPPVITALSLLFTWLATVEARPPDPYTSGSSLLRQGLKTLPRRGRAFAVAAMVLPIVVPYTMYFMWPVNRLLLARSEKLQASQISFGSTTMVPEREEQSLSGRLGGDTKNAKEEEEFGDAGFGLFESTSVQGNREVTAKPTTSAPIVPQSEENVTYQQLSLLEFVKGQVGRDYKSNDALSSHELVDRWGWMNVGRAALVTIGAGFAAWGMVL